MLPKNGRHGRGAAYFERAEALAESIGDEKVLVSQVFNLSFAHQALGPYDLANENLKEALAYYQAKKELIRVSQIHYQVGVLYHEMGKNDRAIQYLEQSLKLSQTLDNPLLQFAGLNFWGSLYRRRGLRKYQPQGFALYPIPYSPSTAGACGARLNRTGGNRFPKTGTVLFLAAHFHAPSMYRRKVQPAAYHIPS